MAVQTKGQQESTKPDKSGNVHNIEDFKKKPNPYSSLYDPIGRSILSAAVKVDLARAIDGMWTPNHPKTGEEPANQPLPVTNKEVVTQPKPKAESVVPEDKVVDGSPPWDDSPEFKAEKKQYEVCINHGKLMQDMSLDLKRWFVSKEPSTTKCQDLHNGLRMWLEAYCPIPNNVCILSDKDKHIARTEASRKRRKALGRPAYEDSHYEYKRVKKFSKTLGHTYWSVQKVYKTTWDTRTKNQNILHPVKGWHGFRSPTVVELLEQAYRQGYSFAAAASKKCIKFNNQHEVLSNSPVDKLYDEMYFSGEEVEDGHTIINNHYQPAPVCDEAFPTTHYQSQQDLEYWRYQRALWQMSIIQFNPITPVHLTDIVKINRVYQMHQLRTYYHWLYSREPFNPHIDYMPMCHRHVDSEHGVAFLYGDRYEGRKAAEFAPASRFNKVTSWFTDCKWNRFLCYYHGFKRGRMTAEQLTEIGKFIYGDIDSCTALLSNAIWEEEKNNANRNGDTPGEILMLPAPAKVNVTPVRNTKLEETYAVASILESKSTSAGLDPNEVSHILLKKAWKNLHGILVPEGYDPAKGSTEIIIDLDDYKKERQAKSA